MPLKCKILNGKPVKDLNEGCHAYLKILSWYLSSEIQENDRMSQSRHLITQSCTVHTVSVFAQADSNEVWFLRVTIKIYLPNVIS